jgi:hypothetical protein
MLAATSSRNKLTTSSGLPENQRTPVEFPGLLPNFPPKESFLIPNDSFPFFLPCFFKLSAML